MRSAVREVGPAAVQPMVADYYKSGCLKVPIAGNALLQEKPTWAFLQPASVNVLVIPGHPTAAGADAPKVAVATIMGFPDKVPLTENIRLYGLDWIFRWCC